jgi:hypothetical protein
MDTIAYHVGDRVILNMKNYQTGQPTHKLEPRWEGPFEVVKVSLLVGTLWLPVNMKIFNIFHVFMVRQYRSNGIPWQSETNDDVRAHGGREVGLTDNGVEMEEWRFEKVIDFEKDNNGQWQYLVKWEGYDEPTGQPAGDLRSCDDAIWEFHNANPYKPGPPAWVARKNKAPKRQESYV